jgi:hypothetical protein
LFSNPTFFIELNDSEYTVDDKKNIKVKPKTKFKVKAIEYNQNREISKIQIIDKNNIVRYEYK